MKDKKRTIFIAPTKKDAILRFKQLFKDMVDEAILEKGFFTCALSGGSTPLSIYQELSKEPFARTIAWDKVYLFWGDERTVGYRDPESNYYSAMESGLKNLPIKKEHIFPIPTEAPYAQSALLYENLLKEKLGTKGFDLVLLGMGEDGHTASLFPDTDALKNSTSLFVANPVPQKHCTRLTLTFKGIHFSKHIIVIVFGKSKAEALSLALENSLPIVLIGTEETPAIFLLDQEAASLLNFS
jgi:6-phosphogluconolactonase